MKDSRARFGSPVTASRPRGARLLEAHSPKLDRCVRFFDHLAFSQWVRLKADPGVLKFCERPAPRRHSPGCVPHRRLGATSRQPALANRVPLRPRSAGRRRLPIDVVPLATAGAKDADRGAPYGRGARVLRHPQRPRGSPRACPGTTRRTIHAHATGASPGSTCRKRSRRPTARATMLRFSGERSSNCITVRACPGSRRYRWSPSRGRPRVHPRVSSKEQQGSEKYYVATSRIEISRAAAVSTGRWALTI